MIKIDLKDRKILYYLLQDSRQSYKKLGKKVGVSSDFVTYRIKRQIDNEIINNFTIEMSEAKLGYARINHYFKYKNISPNVKDEIINFFVNHDLTRYVSSLEGIYDLQVQAFMGDAHEFEAFRDEIKNKFHKNLIFKTAASWIRGETYNFPFLLNESVNTIEPSHWGWGNNIKFIDNLDFKILKNLSLDSRVPTKVLANKLDSTVSIINYRIKKLIKNGILSGYTINVDWGKLGYRWFHLRIYLDDYDKKNIIKKHIRKNPHLIHILKNLISDVDIHCTYLLQNVEELRKIINDLTSKFPNLISNYEFYSTFKIYKYYSMIPKLIDIKNIYNKESLK